VRRRLQTSQPRTQRAVGSTESVTLSDAEARGERTPSRRYLQPRFGCLRCNRGRSWASARIRYLQRCLRCSRCSRCSRRRRFMSWSIRRRTRRPSLSAPQARRPPTTERGMGRDGGAAASGASPAGAFACRPRVPVHRGQADRSAGPPAARAPEAARQHCPFSMKEFVSESNEPSSGNCTGRQPGSRVRAHGILVCVVAAETCLRRKNGRLPGIICKRLQITADLRGERPTMPTWPGGP